MSAPVLVILDENAIDGIVAIEETTAHPTWNRRLVASEFDNTFSTIYGARLKGQLVAYLILHTVIDEVHVVNLAVAHSYRRQGIARDRIVARGYGEQRPVNACINGVDCDEWSHQANRRTEIKVLGVSNINFKEALLVLENEEEDSVAAQESYSIELGVFDDPLPQNRLPKGRVYLEQGGGLYTYRLKGFAEYKEAEKALVEVRTSFPEAYLPRYPAL